MTLLETIKHLTKISQENPELNNETLHIYVNDSEHVFDVESIELRYVDQKRDCTLELDEKEEAENDCENKNCDCVEYERGVAIYGEHRKFNKRIVIYGVDDLEEHNKLMKLMNESE